MFLGQPGAGKTTAANYLVDKYKYIKLSFADPLKEIALSVWPDLKRFKHRQKYQLLGEKLREIDPDIWVDLLLRRFENLDKQGFNVVVDDVRYSNEFYALLGRGFTPILITATGATREERLLKRDGYIDYTTENHQSEEFIRYLNTAITIGNSYEGFELLYQQIEEVLKNDNPIQADTTATQKDGG